MLLVQLMIMNQHPNSVLIESDFPSINNKVLDSNCGINIVEKVEEGMKPYVREITQGGRVVKYYVGLVDQDW